jgi:DNA-directed RNA polymerase subunit RPC12/RpoP
MPLYEYICKKCGRKFSEVIRIGRLTKSYYGGKQSSKGFQHLDDHFEEKEISCPKCRSKEVEECVEPFFAVTSRKS